MTINRTDGGITRSNTYTDDEIRRLHGAEDLRTNTAINRIGGHAGLTQTYHLRGDDQTTREIKEAHQRHIAEEWGLVLGEEGLIEGGLHVVDHGAAKGASLPLLPFQLLKAGYEMTKAVAEDNEVRHKLAAANTKDKMHIIILENLNGLPTGYVEKELSRYPQDEKDSNLVHEMRRTLGRNGDHQMMAVIQLHCDEGMHAARRMYEAKLEPKAFLENDPEIAKLRAEDPAFKAGFDGLVWAKTQGGPAVFDAALKDLGERDVRYASAHVTLRG
jgi:hypothetical protein